MTSASTAWASYSNHRAMQARGATQPRSRRCASQCTSFVHQSQQLLLRSQVEAQRNHVRRMKLAMHTHSGKARAHQPSAAALNIASSERMCLRIAVTRTVFVLAQVPIMLPAPFACVDMWPVTVIALQLILSLR
jgi:hypothetical protein